MEHTLVQISIYKLYGPIPFQSTVQKTTLVIIFLGFRVFLRLENIALNIDELSLIKSIVNELSLNLGSVAINDLSSSLLKVIFPVSSVLCLDIRIVKLSSPPSDTGFVLSCIHIAIGIPNLTLGVFDVSFLELSENHKTISEFKNAFSLELISLEITFVADRSNSPYLSDSRNKLFQTLVEDFMLSLRD
jgi:hypothetical protein